MRIGLDFDNTIVCYDQAILILAEEILELPKGLNRTKQELRDFLRAQGRESEWTAFQGELYGPGMRFAQPFEGAVETMQDLVVQGHELMIVSHRSRRPYAGRQHNLHTAAKDWIDENLKSRGLFTEDCSILDFVETREEKVRRISELRCDVFVDDLPEVLEEPNFPSGTIKVLFDANGSHKTVPSFHQIKEWKELKYCFTV